MKHEKLIKVLSLAGKGFGLVAAFDKVPGVSPETGVLIVLIASCIKDTVNRVIDFLDDGTVNGSNK